MKMKTKRFLTFLTLVFVALAASSCGVGKDTATGDGKYSSEVSLYFANADYNDIGSEKRMITCDTRDSLPEAVMNELIKGPVDTNLRAAIPNGTSLGGIETADLTVTVDLSREFLTYDGDNAKSAELIARYSIVKTLCGLDGIDKVVITVDGKPLLNSQGTPVGALGESDIVFTRSSSENVTQKYMTLYFADGNAQYLTAERRKATLVDNSLEKTIVTEITKGPDGGDAYATVPKETKVLSVETKEGICFVNLSEDFISKFSGGTTEATMAIYSIVNSLSELPDIDKVQFLIDGVKVDSFGDYVFSEPFERDALLIK